MLITELLPGRTRASAVRVRIPVLALLLLLIAAVTIIYWPGLHGPFLFDDFPNILRNPDMLDFRAGREPLAGVLAHGEAGPLGRPLALLSLALQFRAEGPSTFEFKLFNLLVHLLNTLLVFSLAWQLARLSRRHHAAYWALLVAAAWALHPLALTPVLYVVQRMASLSALGVLAALNAMLAGRTALARGEAAWPWLWVAVPVAGLFALACKESGALLPVYLGALELTVFATSPLDGTAQRRWARFRLVMVLVPIALAILALPWIVPRLVHGYASREFTLAERLLTEPRVIWAYLRLLFLPSLSVFGLYHDDMPLSTGWLRPWTTLPAALGLAALLFAALGMRRRAPWFAFSVLFFLAGQLLESTLVPLELMHEHRVYLGMLGPLLGLVLGGAGALERARGISAALWARRVPALVLVAIAALAALTAQRVADWGEPLRMARLESAHHPDSVRAQYDLAEIYDALASQSRDHADRQRLLTLSRGAAEHALQDAPQDSKPWVALILICSQVDGQCGVPQAAWERLQFNLYHDHRAHLMIADVQALAECWHSGACSFAQEELEHAFAALAANPLTTDLDRTLLAGLMQGALSADATGRPATLPAHSGSLQ